MMLLEYTMGCSILRTMNNDLTPLAIPHTKFFTYQVIKNNKEVLGKPQENRFLFIIIA